MWIAQISTDVDDLVSVVDSGPLAVLGLVLLLVVVGGVLVIYNNTSVNRQLINLMSDQNASSSRLKDSIDRNSSVIERMADAQAQNTQTQAERRAEEHGDRAALAKVLEEVSQVLMRHDGNAAQFMASQTEVSEKMTALNEEVLATLARIMSNIDDLKQSVSEIDQRNVAANERLANLVEKLEAVLVELKRIQKESAGREE